MKVQVLTANHRRDIGLVFLLGAGKSKGVWCQVITSHILLAFKYYERITSVGLALLVAFLIGMSVSDDTNLKIQLAYAFQAKSSDNIRAR